VPAGLVVLDRERLGVARSVAAELDRHGSVRVATPMEGDMRGDERQLDDLLAFDRCRDFTRDDVHGPAALALGGERRRNGHQQD
jgi:hypothetical protein